MTDRLPVTRDEVRRDIGAMLDPSDAAEITDTANLLDLGLDSVRIMTLASRWSDTGIPVGFVELIENPTLDAWWTLLSRRTESSA